MCNHNLSALQKVFVSGPFKFACKDCGEKVYREHPKAIFPFNVLFADGMGIIFFAIVFLLFAYLPWFISGVFMLSTLLYFWDNQTEPLKTLTEEQQSNKKSQYKITLVVSVFILAFALWVILK